MSDFEEHFEFDSVYFAKPGDTLDKASKSIMGPSASKSDLEQCKIRLITLNPRLSNPSYNRFGGYLQANQVLSLDMPAEFERSRAHIGSSRLIQHQVAREAAIMEMDPELRSQLVNYSVNSDPEIEKMLRGIGFMSAVAYLQKEFNHVLHKHPLGVELSLKYPHHLLHNLHHQVHGFSEHLKSHAELARKGMMEAPSLFEGQDAFLRRIEKLSKIGFYGKFDEYERRAKEVTTGVHNLNLRMKKRGWKLPRLRKQFNNPIKEFENLKLIKAIDSFIDVLWYVEIAVRGYEVWEAEDHWKEAVFQASDYLGVKGSEKLFVMLICRFGMKPFKLDVVGKAVCPIVVETITTSTYFEAARPRLKKLVYKELDRLP